MTRSPTSAIASETAPRTDDRTVAIHQPNYLPWLGYFDKIAKSDIFVFLDDVEYTSNSFTNRNKIKTPGGWTWLTVPVRSTNTRINDVEIATNEQWRETHRKSLQHNYGKAKYFDEHRTVFERIYEHRWLSLAELNETLVRRICDMLDIDCQFVRSSTFQVDGEKTEQLVELCTELDADRYLSGQGAKSYVDPSQFQSANITLAYQSFDYPVYRQRFDGFEPNLSIIDPLFNVGSDRTAQFLHTDDEKSESRPGV